MTTLPQNKINTQIQNTMNVLPLYIAAHTAHHVHHHLMTMFLGAPSAV